MSRLLTDLFLAELEEEARITRRVLERVPEGRNDWKPHPRSMPLGYLAVLVATLPGWCAITLNQDELDLAPVNGPKPTPKEAASNAELLAMFDGAVARSRAALQATSDAHLHTSWRLLLGGHVVLEQSRLHVLRHSTFNHLAHHRGQLTVYLRLNEAHVPSIYGPTADEPQQFGPA
jgi:uncharacterized damage-inducible protein DinB